MKKTIVLSALIGLGMMSAHGTVLSSWDFDGSGSSAADSLGSNDMTLMGGAAFSGGAMSFNGTDSYLTTAATAPDLNRGTGDLTIKFDLKLTTASTDTFILNKRNPAGGEWITVALSPSGFLKFNAVDVDGSVGNQTAYAQTKPVVGEWAEWEIIVPNNAPVVFKRNGVVDTHSSYNNITFNGDLSNTYPLELGRWSGGGNYLNGELDDVSISVVPEPATFGLFAITGLGALMLRRFRI